MSGFKLLPGPVQNEYRLFDQAPELNDMAQPETSNVGYQEFGQNFGDSEEVKAKHRKKYKRSLDDFEGTNFCLFIVINFYRCR